MACPAAKSAVVIPAVRKGLCNQRVRMVQDIMLAHLFGAPAGMKSATLRQACSLPTHLLCGMRGHLKDRTGLRTLCAARLEASGSFRGTPSGGRGGGYTGRLSTLLRLDLA